MLDMLIKENLGNTPAVFNDDQHDAAEVNSINGEVKNLITQQGGVLTALVDFATDDEFMTNKAVIAAGGWIMPRLSASATEAVFTSGAAGADNFPTIEQFADKLMTFQTGSVSNSGAYTVDYDVDGGLPLVDIGGNPLTAGELPANAIAEIFYDSGNTRWVLKAVGALSSLYFDGNGGVIFPGDEIADLCSDTRNFQLGARGLLVGESDHDVWFGYNAYCKTGSPADQFEKIAINKWAGRSLWDVGNSRYVQQYSLDTDPDSNFTFRDGWGMTEKGDFFYGENAAIGVALDSEWTYTWFPIDKVVARNKSGSPNDYVFTGTNIFPTGTGPTLNVINTFQWEFTIEDRLNGKRYYRGSGAALDTFDLSTLDANILTQFAEDFTGNKRLSLVGPVALGALMSSEFLNNDPKMIQNQLGLYSNLQTASEEFLQDIWGSGFYSNTLFGFPIVDYTFAAVSSSDEDGRTLSFTREGYIVGIGDTGTDTAGTSFVIVSDPNQVVSQIAPIVDEFGPLCSVNNQAEDTIFYVESSNVGGDSNIIRSIDNGATWTKVRDNGAIQLSGLSRIKDGTIIAVNFAVSKIDPTPLFSTDNGETWSLGSTVPNISYSTTPISFENKYQVFAQHIDGDFFYAGPAVTTDQMVIYKATSIAGAWTLIGNVHGASSGGDRGCMFIDPNNGVIYVGLYDASDFATIRRSTDKGVTFTTVYTAPVSTAGVAGMTKIIQTPEGILYALVRETFADSLIIVSTNNGLTWTEIKSSSVSLRDMIYVPADNALYTINDLNAATGFVVDRYPAEREFATADNTVPTKIRQGGDQVNVSVSANTVVEGNQVDFGIPVISFARKFVGILKNIGAAVVAAEAAIGGFFRNTDDVEYLWAKDLDGTTYPLNNSLPVTQLTAKFMTPDPANVGAFATIELGAGATRGSFDILAFPDSGTDYYYSQIAPPKNWTSRKIKYRVSFIAGAIALPADVNWRLAIRTLVKNAVTTNSWVDINHLTDVPDTNLNYWRKSVFSGELEVGAFTPGEDTLNIRITRDNASGNNMDGDAKFSEVEIEWLKK